MRIESLASRAGAGKQRHRTGESGARNGHFRPLWREGRNKMLLVHNVAPDRARLLPSHDTWASRVARSRFAQLLAAALLAAGVILRADLLAVKLETENNKVNAFPRSGRHRLLAGFPLQSNKNSQTPPPPPLEPPLFPPCNKNPYSVSQDLLLWSNLSFVFRDQTITFSVP